MGLVEIKSWKEVRDSLYLQACLFPFILFSSVSTTPPPSYFIPITHALSPISSAYGSACKSPTATYVGLLLTRSPATCVKKKFF